MSLGSPGATSAVRVEGLRELNRALARADRDVRLGVKEALRDVAEPVRADAERLAASEIKNIKEGDKWSKMRIGATQSLVYVAPKQHGARGKVKSQSFLFGLVKVRGSLGKHRPNLAPLLADRAMEPALANNEALIDHRFETMLDDVADRFNR